MHTLIYDPNYPLVYFAWLKPLEQYGFPFSHFSTIPDCNAFFDIMVLGAICSFAYMYYAGWKGKRDREKRNKNK